MRKILSSKYYYVYEHWLDNQCFYVGKSNNITDRANLFFDCLRNDDWSNFVNNRYNEIKVVIVKKFENEQDAYKYEELHSIMRVNEGHPLTCRALGRKYTDKLKKSNSGENNRFYGKNHTNEAREKIKNNHADFSGSNNPNSQEIVLVDKDNNIVKTFHTVKECAEGKWRKDYPRPNGMNTIRKCLWKGLPFHGFYIKYKHEVKK